MSTNISIVDDYTFSLVASQPVVGFFTLPEGTTAPATLPTEVEGEADDESGEATAKVVKAPAKSKGEPKTTEGVETK